MFISSSLGHQLSQYQVQLSPISQMLIDSAGKASF